MEELRWSLLAGSEAEKNYAHRSEPGAKQGKTTLIASSREQIRGKNFAFEQKLSSKWWRFLPKAKSKSLLAKSDPPGVYLRGRAGEVVILILRAFRWTSKNILWIFSNKFSNYWAVAPGNQESHRTLSIYRTVKLKSLIIISPIGLGC